TQAAGPHDLVNLVGAFADIPVKLRLDDGTGSSSTPALFGVQESRLQFSKELGRDAIGFVGPPLIVQLPAIAEPVRIGSSHALRFGRIAGLFDTIVGAERKVLAFSQEHRRLPGGSIAHGP